MDNNYIEFANIKFRGLNLKDLFKHEDRFNIVIGAPTELMVIANENPRFMKIMNDNISTIDGRLPYILAKFKNINRHFEKLSTSTFIYDFFEYARNNNKRFFLLGGLEISNKKSIEIIKNKYGITVDGYSPEFKPYPFEESHNNKILKRIEEFKPDIIFVGFGAPKQEFWTDDNKDFLKSIGVKYVLIGGGVLEFIAGVEKRAPKIIQILCLEWLWRLVQNPSRFKRTMNNFKIFKYLF